MNTNNIILKELGEVAPALLDISRNNIYTVPTGYFEELENTISAIVKQENVGSHLSTANPFSVPEGYFDSLAMNILNKVRSQEHTSNEVEIELQAVAPLLNNINKQPVYTVPDGYFEDLQPDVVNLKTSSKVISISRFTRFTRYAAAAIITGVLAIGGVLYIDKTDIVTDLPVAKIQEYHPEEFQKLSENEIADFLSTQSTAEDVITASNTSNYPDMDVEGSVEEISDTELQQYFKENPEPGEKHNKDG